MSGESEVALCRGPGWRNQAPTDTVTIVRGGSRIMPDHYIAWWNVENLFDLWNSKDRPDGQVIGSTKGKPQQER